MVKWKTRVDQKGVPFPKKQRIKRNTKKGGDEWVLQSIVDIKLEAMGFPFIRIPDSLLRTVFGETSTVPAHVQADISEHLAGWPDSMPIRPIEFKGHWFWIICPMELKTKTGKFTPRQKERQRQVSPFNVIKSQKDFDYVVDVFNEFYEWIK